MTLIVVVLALALIWLEHTLVTTASVVFVVVLLVPSVIVDLLVLFGPKPDTNHDPLARYRSRRD
ncbi:hypothetical protein [Pseudonocardia spinosispora]|uniref:hypothetical protein n=1 Tax=Pseudonocardia spinosispora TaxID=103441 RepID=UPI0004159724|nr:hypothetical protein [Pseudonocardia spinosispora]